jgi:hypothetical protein
MAKGIDLVAPAPSRRPDDPLRIVFTALFFAVLAFPLFYFTLHGVTLAHWAEESVGYRYFYSLRAALGGEYPWLPQGQLPGFYFALLQYALSIAGYPANQIFPRIDVFIFWGALLPPLLGALAFWQLCGTVRHGLARAAILTLFAAVIYGQTALLGTIAIPEYIAWEFPIGIVTCSLLLHVMGPDGAERPTTRRLLLFGAFCGACAGVKITLLIFPLAVCCVFAAINRRPRTLINAAAVVGGTFLLVWFVILLLSAGGSLLRLQHAIRDFMIFAGSQGQTLSLIVRTNSWLLDFLPQFPFDIVPFVILTPLTLLVLAMLSARLRFLIALVPLSLLSIGFYGLRPYWYTMTGTMTFAAVCWVVIVAATVQAFPPVKAAMLHRRATIPTVLVIFSFLIAYGTKGYAGLENLRAQSLIMAANYEKMKRELEAHPGTTALFATDNRYRIPSIEGGICKGGADILDIQWRPNRYVARLFPKQLCYYFVKQPIDVSAFKNVVFISIDPSETAEQARQRVERFFSISLAGFHCNVSFPIYAEAAYHLCFKDAAAPAVGRR